MIKKDRNGTELQYAQLCGCAGSPRRKTGGIIISALALVMMLVLLSACGKGGDIETPTEEPASAGETESFSTEEDSSDAITIDDSAFATTIIEPAPESEPKEEVVVEKTEKEKKEKEEPFSAEGKNLTIVLDPGHSSEVAGGKEPIGPGASKKKDADTAGTRGVSTRVYEYQLALQISLKLRTTLEGRGYRVIMTRSTNKGTYSCVERAKVANDNHADIFVRVHANADPKDASRTGAMTLCITKKNPYIAKMYKQSRLLSDKILNSYVKATGCKKEYVWERDDLSGNNWSTVPTTLIELGYMTNAAEDKKMQNADYQKKMVSGIAAGIDQYFNSVR